ncbi:MAG: site-specific DNA-methyltransferase [Chloroflexi bacterium]|nr:site-specific DNA-methyltransferase [Chloroflexota bacterium]
MSAAPPAGSPLPLDTILHADCRTALAELPEASVDLVFADPPYNLQLSQDLYRPNMTRVQAVDDAWDQFESLADYDAFTRAWLGGCRRVLRDDGALWVIGTYHNIFRIGSILQDLGYWILNDVIWLKSNPMPNFRGVRFTNAHETLIWACKSRGARYAFHHHAMKALNDELQMRSDWMLPLCSGTERLKADGKRAHSTQKPESLLYRVLLATTDPGDVVLDPFFGSGTTGAVARRLGRHYLGIESRAEYVELARARLRGIEPESDLPEVLDVRDRRRSAPRVSVGSLLEAGLLRAGQVLFFRGDRKRTAQLRADGHLLLDGFEGSIHQAGRHLMGGCPCNGWEHWYFEDEAGGLHPLDDLRERLRGMHNIPRSDSRSENKPAG